MKIALIDNYDSFTFNVYHYLKNVKCEVEVFRNQKLVDSKTFKENINYDNLSSKFELKQYENILLKDLVDQIILKINNYINLV